MDDDELLEWAASPVRSLTGERLEGAFINILVVFEWIGDLRDHATGRYDEAVQRGDSDAAGYYESKLFWLNSVETAFLKLAQAKAVEIGV